MPKEDYFLETRDCQECGHFIILRCLKSDDNQLSGILCMAHFDKNNELKEMYKPVKLTYKLEPLPEYAKQHSIDLREMNFYSIFSEYANNAKNSLYNTFLRTKHQELQRIPEYENDVSYRTRMDETYGKAETNWNFQKLSSNIYQEYKEFFDAIKDVIKPFEISKQIEELKPIFTVDN